MAFTFSCLTANERLAEIVVHENTLADALFCEKFCLTAGVRRADMMAPLFCRSVHRFCATARKVAASFRLLELRLIGCERFARLETSPPRENRLRHHDPSNIDTQFLLLLPLLHWDQERLVLPWRAASISSRVALVFSAGCFVMARILHR